jgi:hypothetical protein
LNNGLFFFLVVFCFNDDTTCVLGIWIWIGLDWDWFGVGRYPLFTLCNCHESGILWTADKGTRPNRERANHDFKDEIYVTYGCLIGFK